MRAAVSAILSLLRTGCLGAICRATAFCKFPCDGVWEAIWPELIRHCVSEWVGGSAPRLWFSTASRSNRPKRGGNNNQVGYDAGKEVKGRKIHALVYSEGCRCGSLPTPP